jgi:DNA-nicking Smr family endonuclease
MPERVYLMSGKKATFSVRPFEKLRKTMEQLAASASPPPPQRKKKEQYTDEELFGREMMGVQEIGEFRSLGFARGPRKITAGPKPRDPDQETLDVLEEIAAGERPIHLPDTQEYVEWVNPGHHDSIIPKLHEGLFAVQAFLDLHGCTVAEAEEELDLFLHEAFKKDLRCVKIIHGRGLRSVRGPKVKASVIKRLSGHYRKVVIAYVTARQCDGGLGALYVLLGEK